MNEHAAELSRIHEQSAADRSRLEEHAAAERSRLEEQAAAERSRLEQEAVALRGQWEEQAAAERARVEQELAAERGRAEEHMTAAQKRAEELDAERNRANELEAQRQRIQESIGEERGRLTHERDEVRRTLETAHHELQGLQGELDRVRQMLDAATHERDGAVRARQDLFEREQHLTSELTRERQSREDAVRTREALDASLAEARLAERQSQLAVVERVLTAVRAMDTSRSLSDVLASLTASAASEAPRVALFVLNGGELRGWKSAGFSGEASPLSASVTGRGRARRSAAAARTGRHLRRGRSGGARVRRASAGRAAMAVPLLVGNQPVAVLYADDAADGTPAAPASWPEAIQILGRHASVTLAHLTAARAADAMRRSIGSAGAGAPGGQKMPNGAEDGTSARRYARLLVSEIKLYNEAAVQVGRQKRDLLDAAEAGNRTRAQAVLAADFPGRRFTRRIVPAGTGADAGRRRPVAPWQPRVSSSPRARWPLSPSAAIVLSMTGGDRQRPCAVNARADRTSGTSGERERSVAGPGRQPIATLRANPTAQTLAAAVSLYDAGEYSAAQAALSRLQPSPALLDYVDYYKGLAQLRLKQCPEARRTLEALADRKPLGAISLNSGAGARRNGRSVRATRRRDRRSTRRIADDKASRLGRRAVAAWRGRVERRRPQDGGAKPTCASTTSSR